MTSFACFSIYKYMSNIIYDPLVTFLTFKNLFALHESGTLQSPLLNIRRIKK